MSAKFARLLTLAILMAMIIGALPAAAQDVTLTLWIMPNGPDPAGAIEVELAAFTDATGINVEYEILDWGSAWTRITNAAVSGEGPDVSQLGTTWVAAIDAFGALTHPTEEQVAAVGGADNFVPASWNTVLRADLMDNEPVALPWFVDARAIIYREDVYAELGIDPAEAFADWDSFSAALAVIRDAEMTVTDAAGEETVIAPLAFPGKNDWNVIHNFAPWVWDAGGDMLTEDFSAAAIDTEAAQTGVAYYASLFTDGLTPPDTLELNSAQVDGLWSGGRVATVISGPWMVVNSRTPNEDGGWSDAEFAGSLAVAPMPAGPEGQYAFVGGSDLSLWNNSQYPDEAFQLVEFLLSPESQARYCGNIGMLPATLGTLEMDEFAGDEDYGPFVDTIAIGRSYPGIPAWGPIETVLVTNLGALWDDVAGVNGEFDAATMIPARLEAAATEVNNVIAQSQ